MSDGQSFEWRGETLARVGQLGDALCKLQTAADGAEFWRKYVAHLSGCPQLMGKSPEVVASANIGYLMGYYGREERQRVYELIPQASHPIFGRFESEPTPEEALAAGKRMARDPS